MTNKPRGRDVALARETLKAAKFVDLNNPSTEAIERFAQVIAAHVQEAVAEAKERLKRDLDMNGKLVFASVSDPERDYVIDGQKEEIAQLKEENAELVCTLTSIKSDAEAGVDAVCAENETDPLRIRFFDIIGQASKALNKHKKQDN